jgi:hypothetical protein
MQRRLVSVYVIALQSMRLTDHVTLNLNNNMSTAAVLLDIEKAFDTTWHPGLLYKLHKLKMSTYIIKLIISFLSERQFEVSVEGEMSTPREIQAVVPQGSILSSTLYSSYIRVNDAPFTPGVSPPCRWRLHVCDCSQGGLCYQNTTAPSEFIGVVVWALKHKNQLRWHRLSISLLDVDGFRLILHWMDGLFPP